MRTSRSDASLARRTALIGLDTGGIGVALAAHGRIAAAQVVGTEAMANHPMVGAWMASTPSGLAPGIFSPDGTVIVVVPATGTSPLGTTSVSSEVGTWKPVSERGIHFTAIQLHSDANSGRRASPMRRPNSTCGGHFAKPADTPPLDGAWAAWDTVIHAVDPFLDDLTQERMLEHLTVDGEPMESNIGTMLRRSTSHYWFHTREANAIRQLLGHSNVPEFVGDIAKEAPYHAE